jgi:hypothetical protein
MLVLDDGRGLVAVRPRLRDWVAVRAGASRLDDQLAAGVSPETTAALALRAQLLVRMSRRRALARSLRRIMTRAIDPSSEPLAAVPLRRDRVRDAAGEFGELIQCLLTSGPVAAHGVAQAEVLLSDGRGPLYNRRNRDDLRARLRDIIRVLDPLASP